MGGEQSGLVSPTPVTLNSALPFCPRHRPETSPVGAGPLLLVVFGVGLGGAVQRLTVRIVERAVRVNVGAGVVGLGHGCSSGQVVPPGG